MSENIDIVIIESKDWQTMLAAHTPKINVYLAGPIAFVEDGQAWRDEAARLFEQYAPGRFNCINPLRGSAVITGMSSPNYTDNEMMERDWADVRGSDFVLVHIPDGARTVMTPAEMREAKTHNVPVFTLCDSDLIRHPFIFSHSTRLWCLPHDSLESVVQYLARELPLWTRRRG